MKDLHVFLNEDSITGFQKAFKSCFVKIDLHPPFLFFESELGFLHVFSDGVLMEKLHGFAGVEALRVFQELVLEGILVHAQVLATGRWIVFI